MFGMIFERSIGERPLVQFKPTKDRMQIMPLLKARRHETDRMLRPRSERRCRAGSATGEVIEDHALANVRPADDGHDQERIVGQLRQQLSFEQFKPFAADQRTKLQRTALSFQLPDGRVQAANVFGTGGVGRAHQRRLVSRIRRRRHVRCRIRSRARLRVGPIEFSGMPSELLISRYDLPSK